MTDNVLFVDDDQSILAAYTRGLRKDFVLSTAGGGAQGLEALTSEGPFAVVVSDLRMPGMDGIQFLGEVKKRAPDTVRMMLTGNADLRTAIDAVNEGNIFRFHTKPCSPEELGRAIEAGLGQYRLIRAERDLLEQTLAGSVKVLVDVLSLTDPQAFVKSRWLRDWAGKVARRLELPGAWELDIAAMLSPIGQITLPAEIVAKTRAGAALTAVEQEIVARTPEIGRNLIGNIPRLEKVSEIVYYENKGFDGSGFPSDGVAGTDIPLGARILKVLIDLSDAAAAGVPDRVAFDALEKRISVYDPEILRGVRACLIGEPDRPVAAPVQEVVKLPIDRLRAGLRLASDIKTEDGQLILSAGQEISQAQLELLRNLRKIKDLKEPKEVMVWVPQAPQTGLQRPATSRARNVS